MIIQVDALIDAKLRKTSHASLNTSLPSILSKSRRHVIRSCKTCIDNLNELPEFPVTAKFLAQSILGTVTSPPLLYNVSQCVTKELIISYY